ncbi:LiaF transmembrane domain-containing protein [Heyndrickxia sp. NPDC080065]|uniref:LiaF transmembrane domain-containing protein n=1 Tax=Heyndrickxia sp. NPDC080065 TaxID=3390568 RepID=UPI003CFF7811
MKSWRVGTFSMGASLIFLGVFLVLTQIFHWNAATVMVGWWPVLLIVLGLEILLFLYFSKQEKPIVKYDLLSIFFVGVIGIVGIGLTIVTTTGILDKVTATMRAEQRTLDLPNYDKELNKRIKRVVVDAGNFPLTIESTADNSISMFGTYVAEIIPKQKLIEASDDYLLIKERGDTLYIELKNLPDRHQPFINDMQMKPTLLVPNHVKLEVAGNENPITIKPRNLTNNWSIDSASNVDVQVLDKSDLTIHTVNVEEITGALNQKKKSNTIKFGNGKNQLNISRSSFVNVTKIP